MAAAAPRAAWSPAVAAAPVVALRVRILLRAVKAASTSPMTAASLLSSLASDRARASGSAALAETVWSGSSSRAHAQVAKAPRPVPTLPTHDRPRSRPSATPPSSPSTAQRLDGYDRSMVRGKAAGISPGGVAVAEVMAPA